MIKFIINFQWMNIYFNRQLKEQAKPKTFNDYNKFDLKNFDIKTDGSLVEYKPEFHKNAVVSNINF